MNEEKEKELIKHNIKHNDWGQLAELSKDEGFSLRKVAATEAMRLIVREGIRSVKDFMFEVDASVPIEIYDGPGGEGSMNRGVRLQVRENAIELERALVRTPAWKEILALSQDPKFPSRDTARNVAVEMANIELERILVCNNWKKLNEIAVMLPVHPEHPVRKKAARAAIEILKEFGKWEEMLKVVSDNRFPLKDSEVQRLIADAVQEANRTRSAGAKKIPMPRNAVPNLQEKGGQEKIRK